MSENKTYNDLNKYIEELKKLEIKDIAFVKTDEKRVEKINEKQIEVMNVKKLELITYKESTIIKYIENNPNFDETYEMLINNGFNLKERSRNIT